MGKPAFPVTHDQRIPLAMLLNLLGGPGMNSRLNLALRERLGYVYTVDAQYHAYSNTGLLSFTFGTEKKNLKRSINVIHRELKRVREVPLGKVQLHALKEQMMGHLAMGAENNAGVMLSLGKSLLDQDRIDTLDEIFAGIKKVTAGQLQDLANAELKPESMSTLMYLPKKNGLY